MGYSVEDYFKDVIKKAKTYDALLENINNSSNRKIFAIIKDILKVKSGGMLDGDAYCGLIDLLYDPYGFDYQYAFILCGGDGNGARIAGRLPNGYKLTIENNEKD